MNLIRRTLSDVWSFVCPEGGEASYYYALLLLAVAAIEIAGWLRGW